jgi:hypothetical protein
MANPKPYLWSIAIAAWLPAMGCRSVQAPSSTVLAQARPAAAAPVSWIESASFTYLAPTGQRAPQATEPAVVPAMAVVEDDMVAQPTADKASGGAVRVLGVRYPHPDGRRDVARAELIVADSNVSAPAPDTWRGRLGRAIDGATPGVEWGPGIKQAKGIDIPVAELRELLEPVRDAPPAGARTSTPAAVQGELNKTPFTLGDDHTAGFDELARRVARQGRIISYPGSAAELLGCRTER